MHKFRLWVHFIILGKKKKKKKPSVRVKRSVSPAPQIFFFSNFFSFFLFCLPSHIWVYLHLIAQVSCLRYLHLHSSSLILSSLYMTVSTQLFLVYLIFIRDFFHYYFLPCPFWNILIISCHLYEKYLYCLKLRHASLCFLSHYF